MDKKKKKYFTVNEVANYLEVSKQTISNWINNGKIKVDKLPTGRIKILKADFLLFLEENNLHIDNEIFGFENLKIVVIDDDKKVLQSLETFFFSFCPDCDVKYYSNSVNGLIQIGRIKPDLIILDIEMDNMNGIEVCEKLNNDDTINDTKIIILSGFIDKYKEKLNNMDIYSIIEKPFRYSIMRDILKPFIYSTI